MLRLTGAYELNLKEWGRHRFALLGETGKIRRYRHGGQEILVDEGPGLSWKKGLLMTCIAPNVWQMTLPESTRPYSFKFLVNNFTWSVGPDLTAETGSDITVTPEF